MIVYDKRSGTFTLHTGSTTYQMKADRRGVLLHLYYGPRLGDGDLGYLLQYADRGFSPNPSGSGADRVYSLDTLPQEYATCGVGDYRLSGAEVEQSDGSLLLDLRYADHEICPGKYALEGLPAFHGQGWETLRVVLRDPSSGVEVELLYGVCEEDDLITRAARLTNRGSGPVKLHQAMSLCLDLTRADLDLITFDGGHVRERNLDRAPLRPGVQGVGSVRGTSSHQHNPFVILCEHDAGEDHGLCYGAALLYSGNFIAQAERSQFADTRLVMGVHPHHFLWTLGPGETFTTPEAALVCSPCGLTPLTHRFHRAIRRRLIRDPYQGRRRPVLINNWEATEFDFDADKLVEIAREAAELGMELFVMDDGWFGARDSDMSGLGDWTVNEKKLPGGLEALAPRIRALGLDFGLWIEPEMVSENSGLYRAHPDWALGAPGRPQAVGRSQLVLDFSRREVRDHIYAAMARLLDSAEISYLKWDMNRSLTDVWSAALPADRQGETYHRYVLGVYELLERLHRDYPDLLIEGCSGGGGRFDAGMLYYTPHRPPAHPVRHQLLLSGERHWRPRLRSTQRPDQPVHPHGDPGGGGHVRHLWLRDGPGKVHGRGEGGGAGAGPHLQGALPPHPGGGLLPAHGPLPQPGLHRVAARVPGPAGGPGLPGHRQHLGGQALPDPAPEGAGPGGLLPGQRRRGALQRGPVDVRRIPHPAPAGGLPGGAAVPGGGVAADI